MPFDNNIPAARGLTNRSIGETHGTYVEVTQIGGIRRERSCNGRTINSVQSWLRKPEQCQRRKAAAKSGWARSFADWTPSAFATISRVFFFAKIGSDYSRVESHLLDDTRAETLTYFAVKIAISDYQFLLYMRYPYILSSAEINFIGKSEKPRVNLSPLSLDYEGK